MERGFWAGPERAKTNRGDLRLLSAREVLEARREGDALAQNGKERALCRNACLLARALERRGRPVFADGEAVLNALRVEEIVRLADTWAALNRTCNPSALDGDEEIARRKKAWSTRLMSALSGACSKLLAFCPNRNRRGG